MHESGSHNIHAEEVVERCEGPIHVPHSLWAHMSFVQTKYEGLVFLVFSILFCLLLPSVSSLLGFLELQGEGFHLDFPLTTECLHPQLC